MRVRLDIAYDGTDFAGWAVQPNRRTVQGTLEDALTTVLRLTEVTRLVVAGRTDAGVHATGQVAHVDLDLDDGVDLIRLTRRLSSLLRSTPDVVIKNVTRAPDGFDARFSPLARRYEYRLLDREELRNPLVRHRTVWTSTPLDIDLMNETASSLIGLRDFGAFCKPREGATTIRELQQFTWMRDDTGTLIARLQADAFCHSMVRALVGACVEVGSARLALSELGDVRDAAQRTSDFKIMPAHGLTLTEVIYPPDEQLGLRADLTRAKRDMTGHGSDS
ncbi:MAG: tRNA pseudouridine(38-40) synthase TruA [Microbacteriaceae bacterium]|jgi:tRNA pseudouridine38-40 synthase